MADAARFEDLRDGWFRLAQQWIAILPKNSVLPCPDIGNARESNAPPSRTHGSRSDYSRGFRPPIFDHFK